MNLQQLYYFRMIAELEHYTKAADRLNVTQSSLSHAINDLENELGVHLFERQGRNVKLTKYGAIFLEYARQALDALDEGKNKLNDFIHPEQGVVSLAYFSSLEDFVPYLVASYYAQTDNLHTRFQFYQLPYTGMEKSLLDGTADLAIGTRLADAKLCSHQIGTHNMALIVSNSHALAADDAVDLALLGAERFITYDYQCQVRSHIDDIFKLVGIEPPIVSETTHDTIIYSSVAANFGVALVPEPLGMRHYNVKALALQNPVPERQIYLTWKNVRYMSPAIKNFRDFMIKNGLILDQFRQL